MQRPCPGLSRLKKAGFTVKILRQITMLPIKKSKVTVTEKGETFEWQGEEFHHFHYQGDCSH
jgi:hypothetical protein